ncbi:hypothetical protein KDM41_15645 [bacterium]|nr:hypothetical protein [bacterium]
MAKFTTILILTLAAAATAGGARASTPTPDMALKGDRDGTVFRSLTVEGENRVQIRFERPRLEVAVDPEQAPGLLLEDGLDILDRTLPDLVGPLLATSVTHATPHGPRPWLQAYERGPVARFVPDLADVATWKLSVVDSRGQTAMVFAGQGDPPADIAWDGQRLDGTPAPPGYTYSIVLEARDPAGNERRFVGDGFTLPAYRRLDAAGPVFLVSGDDWLHAGGVGAAGSGLLLEAAAAFNTHVPAERPVRVVATHRSAVEAERLGRLVAGALGPLVIGPASRIEVQTRIEPTAPAGGTLELSGRP